MAKQTMERGAREVGDIAVPSGVTEIEIAIDRADFKDSKLGVYLCCFYSADGRAWRPVGGIGCVGGEIMDADTKQASTKSSIMLRVPNPELKGRVIRTALVTSQGATTRISYEAK
ncbi:MAG TPA: hypothetical protein VLL97_03650 [Acidobacteriota bacterium]|nr:hypothetical protein [Acidobacteriota bacterium]